MNKINNYFLYIDFSLVNKILLVFLLVFGLNTVNAQVVTDTVTATGSGTFVPPSGVSSIRVEAWGAGGRGASRTSNGVGSGGGGGGYSKGLINVTPTQTYHYTVGAGGNTATGTGGVSWFNATANINSAPTSSTTGVLARGGSNKGNNNNTAGGGATLGYGNEVTYTGGNGAAGPHSGVNRGGGGGSSAGTESNGTNATGTPGAVAPSGGGNGGAGRNEDSYGPGNVGIAPGGGGGGAYRSSWLQGQQNGGAGAAGQIVITYLPAITGSTNLVVSGTSTLSNSVSGGTWSSSNPLIATVNPSTGEVTGVAPGSVAITYTTPDGLSRFIIITVFLDSDGDGIPNGIDLDSDNDGIPDCVEKGLSGEIDNFFNLKNNATKMSPTEVRLTQALNDQRGQMWSFGTVDFSESFSISFEARLSSGSNDGGADGIATVFHNDPAGIDAESASTEGSSIGALGIQNGIVLEIDTFQNSGAPMNDPSADHIHIWRSSNQQSLTSIASFNENIENGNWYPVTITWNAVSGVLTFSVAGSGNPILTYTNLNIINDIFGGASQVHFGYTSSTGGSYNDQRVRFGDDFCGLPFSRDTDGDGIPDYLDLDSDGDGCPDAIEGSGNISHSMLNPNGSIAGPVDANGIPTAVNGGQGAGSAYNPNVNECEKMKVKTNPMIRQRVN